MRLTERLSSENIAILNEIDNPVFRYAITTQAFGPVWFYLDNLRVDLVPIPERLRLPRSW